MPTILEQLQSITGGSSIAGDLGAQAGQFTQIAQSVAALVQNPPGDLAGYLGGLQGLRLPQVSLAGDLGKTFTDLLPSLQGELGGLLQPLLDSAGSISEHAGGGLGGTFEPLLKAIASLKDLLATDWSCGLLPSLAPPEPPPAPPGPSASPSPASLPAAQPPAALSQEQVDHAVALVGALPADMTAPALLKWLHGAVGTYRPGYFSFRSIPVLDDLRDPLDTLVRWDGQGGTELAQELGNTLNAVAAVVRSNTAALTSAPFTAEVAALPAESLAQAGGTLGDALDALLTAVQAKDSGAAATHLSDAKAAEAAVETANGLVDAQQAALEALLGGLQALPSRLETGICRLLVLLQPRAAWGDLSGRLIGAPAVASDDTFKPLADLFGRVKEFFDKLLGLVDVAAVTQPVADLLNRAGAAIDGLEQGLAQLTAGARAQFQQAQSALGAFDPDGIQEQAAQALRGAVGQVQQTVTEGLAPAAAAVGTALEAVDGALSGFDPEALAKPVQDVLAAIKQVFEDPAVLQLVEQLKKLKTLADKLKELSFQPVGDAVISGIGDVKSALGSIDASKLPPPMPEMIQAAMSILPPSLTPLTDPLLSGLDDLIDQGPIPLLEGLRDLPKSIVDHLKNFSPRELLEEPLGAPFRELRKQMEEFAPGHWLDVAEQELDGLKGRLVQSLDLGALLAPLAEAQKALLDELGRFRPGELLAPLAGKIEEAVKSLAAAVPTGELTLGLDQVFGRIGQLTGTVDQALKVADALSSRLALLADPDAQLDQWLGEILTKLPADAPANLAAPLAALSQAVQEARASALQGSYGAARQALADKLGAGGAKALLARLLQGRSRLTPALVHEVPDPARTQLETWLAAFDPAGPTFSRGLRRLGQLGDALAETDRGVAALLADWDARYHRDDGILAALAHDSVTVDQLRTWVREAIDRQLGSPVAGFLRQLKVLGRLLTTFTGALKGMVQALEAKLNELLAAPQALAQAAQKLRELQDRLSHLDLDVFTREVDDLYRALLDKLRALDPRALEQGLRAALEEALAGLGLDAVLTPGLRSQLDQTYQALKSKVDALDPELLVVKPLDDLYQKDILPLVDVLDVGDAVQAVIDRLTPLPDELRSELGRVDSAYQDMLAAAPSGGPGGTGGSASVGA